MKRNVNVDISSMVLKQFIKFVTTLVINYNKLFMIIKIIYYKNKGIKIGRNFSISSKAYLDLHKPEYIEIGDNVKITRWAMILSYDSAKDIETFRKYFNRGPYRKVKIGDNVYIGAQSIIMPGVTIGNNVIIGANSVVTHDIPSNCIVAGSPARKIHELNFNN
jgi:maltose O-acetyltransferase